MGSVLKTIYACKLRPYGVDLITFKKIILIEKERKKKERIKEIEEERKNKRNRRRKKE